jgi:hypothetical protein
MRSTRRTFIASTLALLATPAILRRARADAPQLTLKLHHSFSAVSAVHEKFLAPWARKVGLRRPHPHRPVSVHAARRRAGASVRSGA